MTVVVDQSDFYRILENALISLQWDKDGRPDFSGAYKFEVDTAVKESVKGKKRAVTMDLTIEVPAKGEVYFRNMLIDKVSREFFEQEKDLQRLTFHFKIKDLKKVERVKVNVDREFYNTVIKPVRGKGLFEVVRELDSTDKSLRDEFLRGLYSLDKTTKAYTEIAGKEKNLKELLDEFLRYVNRAKAGGGVGGVTTGGGNGKGNGNGRRRESKALPPREGKELAKIPIEAGAGAEVRAGAGVKSVSEVGTETSASLLERLKGIKKGLGVIAGMVLAGLGLKYLFSRKEKEEEGEIVFSYPPAEGVGFEKIFLPAMPLDNPFKEELKESALYYSSAYANYKEKLEEYARGLRELQYFLTYAHEKYFSSLRINKADQVRLQMYATLLGKDYQEQVNIYSALIKGLIWANLNNIKETTPETLLAFSQNKLDNIWEDRIKAYIDNYQEIYKNKIALAEEELKMARDVYKTARLNYVRYQLLAIKDNVTAARQSAILNHRIKLMLYQKQNSFSPFVSEIQKKYQQFEVAGEKEEE